MVGRSKPQTILTNVGPLKTRVFWHPSSAAHDTGLGHPESPRRIEAVMSELRAPNASAFTDLQHADPAEESAIIRVHPPDHVEKLQLVSAHGGGRLDQDTVMSAESWQAATHAAGAAMAAVDSALSGVPAFAAVRPPGHHALATTAMGFCLLNNVVIAARSAIDDHGLDRILIIDWDVHHGNGTQDLVQEDVRIRYVSLHQWPLYPGTGRAEERGVGNVFNVPRPPGLPRDTYVRDLNEAVERATDSWTPQLILISAGFDALMGDPLAGFTLEPEDYATWIRTFRSAGAPIAAVLEGGYVPGRVATATRVTVQEMAVSGAD